MNLEPSTCPDPLPPYIEKLKVENSPEMPTMYAYIKNASSWVSMGRGRIDKHADMHNV